MKQFAIWLAIFLLLFGGLSGFYHFYLSSTPQRVLVAIDVSESMNDYKLQIHDKLDFLRQRKYTEFAVITNSTSKKYQLLHDWQTALDTDQISQINMYTNLELSGFLENEKIRQADEIIFVTNSKHTDEIKNRGTILSLD